MDEIVGGTLYGSVAGILNGDVELVTGKQRRALYTNGLDQWVDLGNQRDNCMGDLEKCSNGFVMAMWLKMHRYHKPGTTDDEYYLTNGGHTKYSMGVVLLMRTKVFLVSFRTASRYWYVTTTAHNTLYTWHHVVLTWDATNGGKIYTNGMLDGEERRAISYTSNRAGDTYTKFIVGCENMLPPRNAAEMTLDELRIWDAEMNEQEVWLMYVSDALS